MELTLNLVWVCVAIAGILALVAVLSRAAESTDLPANTRQKIVAMGCTLVILFFVISMTDDLHDQQVLVEERKGSSIAAAMGTLAHSPSPRSLPTDFLLFFPPESFFLTLSAARRSLGPSESLFVEVVKGECLCSRAPPAPLA